MTTGGSTPSTPAHAPIPGLLERFEAFGGSFKKSFTNLRTLYRWALIGITVGVIAGVVAIAFFVALQEASDLFLGTSLGINLPVNGVPPPATPFDWTTNPSTFWILPGMMVAGGLGVGGLITWVAPETEGHGTDQAIRSFHRGRGTVRARVPPVKFLASVLTLGTGGSGGREGPTAQIGSGIGSIVGGPLGLSTKERRIAIMVGVGAGIGAIFKAPFGAALLASEILYISDFEPDVIMPAILASVISYSIFGIYDGFGSEFVTPAGLGFTPEQLPVYALLGGICAGFGVLYVVWFYGSRRWFARSRIPRYARPAFGVAIVGVIFAAAYYLLPQENHLLAIGSIGIGYGFVQWLVFQNSFTPILLAMIVALIILKIGATSLTVGSGGSAGLFGAGVVTGALIGFAVAGLMTVALPGLVTGADFAAFAVIGMMAFFGSVSKAPIAVILMVVEMTGSEALLVPAMVAIFVAYFLTGRYHLYHEQVPNRLDSPSHTTEYFSEYLRHVPVSNVVAKDVGTVSLETNVASAAAMLRDAPVPILAVMRGIDLLGEVRMVDVLEIPPSEQNLVSVREILRENPPPVHPDMSVLAALGVMDQEETDAVLVFTSGKPRTLNGVLTRERIAQFQSGSSLQR